jgi:hypothetical protein
LDEVLIIIIICYDIAMFKFYATITFNAFDATFIFYMIYLGNKTNKQTKIKEKKLNDN